MRDQRALCRANYSMTCEPSRHRLEEGDVDRKTDAKLNEERGPSRELQFVYHGATHHCNRKNDTCRPTTFLNCHLRNHAANAIILERGRGHARAFEF